MNKILFSVVIPLFNKEKSVIKTLNSIVQQRYPASEIIIVDDGSTDLSVKQVLALDIPNLRVIKQANRGVSAARNTGVSHAKNEFIAFIDADDQWSPFFLEEMRKLITRFPVHEFFASSYQKVVGEGIYQDPKLSIVDLDATGCLLPNYFDISGHGDLPFMASSMVITKRLFSELGGFPVGEAMGEDQAFFSLASLNTNIVYSPLVLLFYHTDTENRACERHLPQELLPFAQRLVSVAKSKGVEESLKKSILIYCAAHACHLAKLNLQAGNIEAAKHLLSNEVCKFKPLHLIAFRLWSYLSFFKKN
jgi:glycosyltransferase involved in cell wall biosynthesis